MFNKKVQSNCETESGHLQSSIYLQQINEVKHRAPSLPSIWCFLTRGGGGGGGEQQHSSIGKRKNEEEKAGRGSES